MTVRRDEVCGSGVSYAERRQAAKKGWLDNVRAGLASCPRNALRGLQGPAHDPAVLLRDDCFGPFWPACAVDWTECDALALLTGLSRAPYE
jgi:hypothetical protein